MSLNPRCPSTWHDSRPVRSRIDQTNETTPQRNPPQPAALVARVRPPGLRVSQTQTRIAHAAFRVVRSGHRPPGGAAEPRHRIGGGQDGRWGRRAAQCHAGKPDGTGHRAHRLARRAIHAGEGVHCRRDCHQLVVHAGRVVSPRWAEVSHAGIQPRQRPVSGGPALPGHGRAVGSLGDLAGRLRGRGGLHPEVERGALGPAHDRLRTGHVVFAQDAPRVFWQRRTCRAR